MKKIPLTQGYVALVDDGDFDELSKYKWCAHKHGKYVYAVRAPLNKTTGRQHTVQMHSDLMGTPAGMETDHINGNGLDNRRKNLRIVTTRQNQQNQHVLKTSKYPGVSWDRKNRKWRPRISFNGKDFSLGEYTDEERAARRYKIACDWQVIEL